VHYKYLYYYYYYYYWCVAEKFMYDNIVGTVLVLSLIFWIPLVYIFRSIVSISSAHHGVYLQHIM